MTVTVAVRGLNKYPVTVTVTVTVTETVTSRIPFDAPEVLAFRDACMNSTVTVTSY